MFGSNQENATTTSCTNVSECRSSTSSDAASPSSMDIDNSIEEGRGFRTKKKQTDPACCPVCSITVRDTELESHYHLEMDKLTKISTNRTRKQLLITSSVTTMPQEGTSTTQPEKCWDMYQTIKNNRQSRLKIKNRKRKVEVSVCPICEERTTNIIDHVEQCLPRCDVDMEICSSDNTTATEDSEIDVEGDGVTFQEYEWAGQTRVRACSMLQGGYAAAGLGNSVVIRNASSEDEDLVVDGDDSEVFGPSQYTEGDVIFPMLEDSRSEEMNALRRAIIGSPRRKIINGSKLVTSPGMSGTPSKSDLSVQSASEVCVGSSPSSSPASSSSQFENHVNGSDGVCQGQGTAETQTNKAKTNTNIKAINPILDTSKTSDPVIESLKARIRDLESQTNALRRNDYKCLICMDAYQTPVVSICCWHIHCEECWLHTLGAKKLCPQCNMITSPRDLRRVFM